MQIVIKTAIIAFKIFDIRCKLMHFCYENIWWTGNKEVPLRHY